MQPSQRLVIFSPFCRHIGQTKSTYNVMQYRAWMCDISHCLQEEIRGGGNGIMSVHQKKKITESCLLIFWS